MKAIAMIFAVLAFGGSLISLWMFYHLKTEAHRANGERWPVLKSWMWNMPLRVSDFQGHAADLAAASTKAGMAFFVCFVAGFFAFAIATGKPEAWDMAFLGLILSPVLLGLSALHLRRSSNGRMGQ